MSVMIDGDYDDGFWSKCAIFAMNLLDKTYNDHDHVQQSLVSGASGNDRK